MECKYYDRCEYADDKSFMCSKKGGGSYCGKYRILCTESAPVIEGSAHKQGAACPEKV